MSVYTIEQDCILILAVMHCSREPGYWKSRKYIEAVIRLTLRGSGRSKARGLLPAAGLATRPRNQHTDLFPVAPVAIAKLGN